MKRLTQTLYHDVQIIRNSVELEFYQLSDNVLTFKPDATQWSILECFEHLNRYASYYLPVIEIAIEKAGRKSTDQLDIDYTWIGKYSIKSMHPSNVKRQKTFQHMDPAKSQLKRNVLDKFLANQTHLLQLLDKARFVDINKKRVPLEFFRLIKMNIGEAIEFVIVHEQRHLQQAKHVLEKHTQSQPPVLIL